MIFRDGPGRARVTRRLSNTTDAALSRASTHWLTDTLPLACKDAVHAALGVVDFAFDDIEAGGGGHGFQVGEFQGGDLWTDADSDGELDEDAPQRVPVAEERGFGEEVSAGFEQGVEAGEGCGRSRPPGWVFDQVQEAVVGDGVEGTLCQARVGCVQRFKPAVVDPPLSCLGVGGVGHVGGVVDPEDLPGVLCKIKRDLAGRAADVQDVSVVAEGDGGAFEAGGVVRALVELGVVLASTLVPEIYGGGH